jgi:hypothetical protein
MDIVNSYLDKIQADNIQTEKWGWIALGTLVTLLVAGATYEHFENKKVERFLEHNKEQIEKILEIYGRRIINTSINAGFRLYTNIRKLDVLLKVVGVDNIKQLEKLRDKSIYPELVKEYFRSFVSKNIKQRTTSIHELEFFEDLTINFDFIESYGYDQKEGYEKQAELYMKYVNEANKVVNMASAQALKEILNLLANSIKRSIKK